MSSSSPPLPTNLTEAQLQQLLQHAAQQAVMDQFKHTQQSAQMQLDDIDPDAPEDREYDCEYTKNHPDWPFNQLSVDYSVLGCPEIEVVDAKDVNSFFFYKNFVAKNRPCVINGLLDNWPAMKLWDDAYFLDKMGETEVTIDFTPDGRADAVVNNGNYPVVTPVNHKFNNNNNNNNNTTPTSPPTIPEGYYSDLFALPMSKKMKFKDFLPYVSYYPEIVHNHNHRNMEYEYLYTLHQFNVLNHNPALQQQQQQNQQKTNKKTAPPPTQQEKNIHKSLLIQALPPASAVREFQVAEEAQLSANEVTTHLTTLYHKLQKRNQDKAKTKQQTTTTPSSPTTTNNNNNNNNNKTNISAQLKLFSIPGVPYCQRQNGSFKDEYPLLHNDIPIDGFDWAQECFNGPPEAVNIWIGSSFSHTSLHQDHFENLYAVIQGEKQFVLAPPSEVYWLQKAKLPTVRWALIKGFSAAKNGVEFEKNVKELEKEREQQEQGENNENGGRELQLYVEESGDDDNTNNTNKNNNNKNTNKKNKLFFLFNHPVEKKMYKFYVVDRTTGDNCEYTEAEDLTPQQPQPQTTTTQDIKQQITNNKAKQQQVEDPEMMAEEEEQQQHNMETTKSVKKQLETLAQSTNEEEKQQFVQDLTPVDYSFAQRPYVITKTECYYDGELVNPTKEEQEEKEKQQQKQKQQQKVDDNNNNNDIPAYPLVMVKKGSYVTFPIFDIPYVSSLGDDDDDLKALFDGEDNDQQNNPITNDQLLQAHDAALKKQQDAERQERYLKKMDLLQKIKHRVHNDIQITPWIDVDIEVNPFNITPGSNRTKHQQTNSHIVRYVANVKRGQVLYLPKQWYHSVRQKNKTVSINFWYGMDYDAHYVLHEFIRRTAEAKHAQFKE